MRGAIPYLILLAIIAAVKGFKDGLLNDNN